MTKTLRCVPSMVAASMLVPSLQYITLQQFKTLFQFRLHTIYDLTNYYIGPIYIMVYLHQVRMMSYLK